ncbi:Uncharacterized protein PCOAH_00006070 [Plasmodium coatneyi]|uniref:RanBD1 domain-containing protein n=1 Tax=Plasmodium coatneyi TaxID=208452 RepID=A0A1B1DTG7_9APIC|nr:Uncharacterized protein PCOAH_00006070 [Plasmodium coatneyi]ANQ06096.1 Uncharacterized protein PCOAH_00006070 [Plasmodium coatneyi]
MEINSPESKKGNTETKNSKKRSIEKIISPTKIAKTDVDASEVNEADDIGKSQVELGENESSPPVEEEPSECLSNEFYGDEHVMVGQGQAEEDVGVEGNILAEAACMVDSQKCSVKKKEKKKSARNNFAEETKKTIQKERKKVEKGNKKKKKHIEKGKNDELREFVVKLAEGDSEEEEDHNDEKNQEEEENDDENEGEDDAEEDDYEDDDDDNDEEEEEESKEELLDDVSDEPSDEVSDEEANEPEEETDEEGKDKEEESPKGASIERAKEGDEGDNASGGDEDDVDGEARHDDLKDSDKENENDEDDQTDEEEEEEEEVDGKEVATNEKEDEEEEGEKEEEDQTSKENFDEEDATPRKGSDDEKDLTENETNKSSLNKNQKSDNESAASESSDIKKNDRLFASMNDYNSPNKLFSEHVGKLNIFGNVNIDIEKLRQRLNKNKNVTEEKKEVKISEAEDPFENEEVVYSESNIKISKFIKKSEKYDWSGYLPVKIQIMKNVENKKYRILCFQKGSGRLFLNTDIFEGFKIIPSKSTSALFSGRDLCDEKKLNQYIVTFMSSTSRDEFVKHIKKITNG